MFVQQFFVTGLAHSSYLLGGTETCAIVDPRRDVGIYLDAAKSMGMRITHIFETHLHADFISGHLDLAEKTGAKIYAPKTLVDVRSQREYQQYHIEGTLSIPAPDLRTHYEKLDGSVPIVMLCNTGHRSSLGASILKQHGFEDVSNLAGGMVGYNAAGYGPECPVCFAPHGPTHLGKPSH